MNNWYPNLTGKIHNDAAFAIRKVMDSVYALTNKTQGLEGKINAVQPPNIANISQALQVSGSNPLNINGLIGLLAQPQKAIVTVSSATGTPSSGITPTPSAGQLQIQNGQLFFFDNTTSPGQWRPVTAVGTMIIDTFVNLTNYDPTTYPVGTMFWASDNTVLYTIQVVSLVNTWVYILGTDSASTISALPTLSTSDAGYKLYDAAWDHTWQWDGTFWNYQPDEPWEPGDIKWRASSSAPLKSGWHIADGSTVTATQNDATTTSITLPDMRTYYIKATDTYIGVGIAAHPATILGQPLSTGSASTGDNVSVGAIAVQSGAGTTVVNGVTFVPAAGGHAHTIPTLTNNTDGTPATFSLVPWFRL